MLDSFFVSAAVEGPVDEAILRRLVEEAGGRLGAVYGRRGKERLRKVVDGYNSAAQRSPWVVLVDLDRDFDCAPPLVESWLPSPARHMCFRIAVRAIESWLLADRERAATFLGVGAGLIPQRPETLSDPKRALIDIARRSRRAAVRLDIVPRPGSGRLVGPAYSSRMIEFATDDREGWRPTEAAAASDSLARAQRRIRELVAGGYQ